MLGLLAGFCVPAPPVLSTTLCVRWVSSGQKNCRELVVSIQVDTRAPCSVLSHCSRVRLCDHMDCGPPGPSVHGDSPGKSTGVGCHALLQGIFLTQESNRGLLHCRRILFQLSYPESPCIPYDPANSTPRYVPNRWTSMKVPEVRCKKFYSPKLETR